MDVKIPLRELQARANRVQEQLVANGFDGALIIENTNLYYFTGTVPSGFYYIPAQGDPVLLVRKNMDRARQESSLENLIPLNSMRNLLPVLKEQGFTPKRVAMELDILPVRDYARYQKIFGDGSSIEDISGVIRNIRAVKSPYEIELIRKSGQIHHQVFTKIQGAIKEGMTDLALSAQMEYEMRMAGHLGYVRFRGLNHELFMGQVLVGPPGAAPTCYDIPAGGQGLLPLFPQGPNSIAIEANQPITMDFVGNYTGYIVDQTRLFSVGKLPANLEKAQQVALAVQAMVEEEGKPGANAREIYDKAVEIANQAGLGDHFMGYKEPVTFIGHGVGLELNEFPVIARGLDLILEPGNVFALEPKFIFPEYGVVGLENTYLVTDAGLERITVGSGELIEV